MRACILIFAVLPACVEGSGADPAQGTSGGQTQTSSDDPRAGNSNQGGTGQTSASGAPSIAAGGAQNPKPKPGTGGSGGAPNIIPEGRVAAYIAQGHMGRIIMSCDDGKSWIQNHSVDDSARCFKGDLDCDHSPHSSTGLVYGNGWFVAAWGWGHPGTLDRSKDGVHWERVLDTTPTFANLTFGKGMFLANSSPLRFSTDGAEWQTGGDPGLEINQRSIDYIDYDGGRFIMTAESGTQRNILYSSDGKSWTPATTRPDLCGSYYTGLATANGTTVVSEGQGNICYTQDGGVSWTLVKVDEYITSPVIWSGTEFRVYSGATLHASADGITWSSETVSPANISIGPMTISPHGTMLAANGGWQVWYEKQQFYRSTNGRNWDVLPPDKFVGSHPLRFITFGYVEPGAGCPAR